VNPRCNSQMTTSAGTVFHCALERGHTGNHWEGVVTWTWPEPITEVPCTNEVVQADENWFVVEVKPELEPFTAWLGPGMIIPAKTREDVLRTYDDTPKPRRGICVKGPLK
jgi:hypothetical protein